MRRYTSSSSAKDSSLLNIDDVDNDKRNARPPRNLANPLTAPPYEAAANISQPKFGRNRSSTPPRRPGDPGVKVDSNFAYEDWDEDSPVKKDAVGQYNRNNTANTNPIQSDPNWLEENFDD